MYLEANLKGLMLLLVSSIQYLNEQARNSRDYVCENTKLHTI